MTKSMITSVIIPTRDRVGFLREAVTSVLTQTLRRCEVIVVDDASSDGTAGWLADQDPARVVALRFDDHVERAVARNHGLAKAGGEYVLFLDDDDRLRASALDHLSSALNGRPDAVGAVGARVLFSDEGQRRRLPHPRRRLTKAVWLDLLGGWMSPPGTVLWRTDVVRAVGGWDETITFSGDYELFLRMSRQGDIVFVPDIVLDKRAHGDQWRPADIRERTARWMNEFANSLPPHDRRRALRAMAARRQWNDARIAYGNLRPRDAVVRYLQAIRTSPLLMFSPLLRPQIARGMTKSMVAVVAGREVVHRARATKRRVARRLGRDVSEHKHRV